MNLSQHQQQKQTLTPQLMHAMEVLQMGAQELLSHIETTLEENPVLELGDAVSIDDEMALFRRKLEWLSQTDHQNSYYYQSDRNEEHDPLRNVGVDDFDESDFFRYVSSQLDEHALGQELYHTCLLLIECLNESGHLTDSLAELAADFSLPLPLLEQALTVVQSLEPAGVAGRDLRECLLLQLSRWGDTGSLAYQIVDHHLDDLGSDKYAAIARALDTDTDTVLATAERIRALSPRPAAGFSVRERLSYIAPDIFVVQFADHFDILTNDYYFPRLHLSGYYARLLKETDDAEVKSYLDSKIKQAKLLMNSMENRTSTLLRCAHAIVARQEAFFRHGQLRPMTLANLAEELAVHESTVSRALRDKFLQCSKGVFPLSYFFSRAIGGEDGISPDQAKSTLRTILDSEDKEKPLSDQKICDLMAVRSCPISRRTVAKYREELGIKPAAARRVL